MSPLKSVPLNETGSLTALGANSTSRATTAAQLGDGSLRHATPAALLLLLGAFRGFALAVVGQHAGRVFVE